MRLHQPADEPLLCGIGAPITVEAADSSHWASTADLIVIGLGGAGAAAAIEAAERGLDVLALDRFDGGGATALSGGVTYACSTEFQRQAGFSDTADDMFEYLLLENTPVHSDTLRRFCDGSNADLEWLVAHGVKFDSALFGEKTIYPPDGKFLYFSGNEKVPRYKERARPAPRGHRTVGKGLTGHVYFGALKAAALKAGVRVISHAPVRRLVLDRAGVVIGAEAHILREPSREMHQAYSRSIIPLRPFRWRRHASAIRACSRLEDSQSDPQLFRARYGVLLSAGGFVFGQAMLARHKPLLARLYKSFLPAGALSCDGSGIELGRSVGGQTRWMDSFFLGKVLAPPPTLVRGILVDAAGRRFINEDAYLSALGNAMAGLTENGKAWLILDHDLFWSSIQKCISPEKGMFLYTLPALANILLGGTRRAKTLSALAKKCRFDVDTLSATVSSYNATSQNGTPDFYGKDTSNLAPMIKPPFYAVRMDLGNAIAPSMAFSLGGLAIDEASGAVLDPEGRPIRHLYAAGRNAVGLCSNGYISGMSIADTVFSGRRAARAISARHGGSR